MSSQVIKVKCVPITNRCLEIVLLLVCVLGAAKPMLGNEDNLMIDGLGTYEVLSDYLSVRNGPGMEYGVVDVLRIGSTISGGAVKNDIWLRIDEKQYVSLHHLKLLEDRMVKPDLQGLSVDLASTTAASQEKSLRQGNQPLLERNEAHIARLK